MNIVDQELFLSIIKHPKDDRDRLFIDAIAELEERHKFELIEKQNFMLENVLYDQTDIDESYERGVKDTQEQLKTELKNLKRELRALRKESKEFYRERCKKLESEIETMRLRIESDGIEISRLTDWCEGMRSSLTEKTNNFYAQLIRYRNLVRDLRKKQIRVITMTKKKGKGNDTSANGSENLDRRRINYNI